MIRVLDASALLAFLHGESGDQMVAEALEEALVSAVNWAEVIQKSIAHGVNIQGMREDMIGMGVTLETFTPAQAELVAGLWPATRALGLSLADRACLSLALIHECPVMTADRIWDQLDLGFEIQLIR